MSHYKTNPQSPAVQSSPKIRIKLFYPRWPPHQKSLPAHTKTPSSSICRRKRQSQSTNPLYYGLSPSSTYKVTEEKKIYTPTSPPSGPFRNIRPGVQDFLSQWLAHLQSITAHVLAAAAGRPPSTVHTKTHSYPILRANRALPSGV